MRTLPALLSLPLLGSYLVLASTAHAENEKGAAIYAQRCAECHGANGEGVAGVRSEPLIGDLSVRELTKYISDTMPEDDPAACVGEDAAAVAAYIHETFYSVTAQFKNRPMRIELSRLTVRQYQNSIADLIGAFAGSGTWDAQRGLEANYYNSRQRRRENRVVSRIDPVVDVNFGEAFPDGKLPEKKEGQDKPDPAEYSLEWNGSVLAPETGLYEFVVVTENGVQLWINDTNRPIVDARVKSGSDTEHRGTVFLLGGRAYSLRLEINKAKSEKTASAQLRWKPPHHAEELLPERQLLPRRVPTVLVVETPFPPDDKSVGYERGAAVSPEWNEATTFAALEIADKVIGRLNELAKLGRESDRRTEQLRDFCLKFAERAFRRPLTDAQRDIFVERQFRDAPDTETAVKRVVLLVLKSPRFLFPGAAAESFDDYRAAEWLALALWDSLPDDQLLRAAAEGKLSTREQLDAQARRMVDDVRTRAKVRGFFHQWLHFDHFHDVAKESSLYPGFEPAIASDLRTSLEFFIEDVVWSERSDYRELLAADYVLLNSRLARFYGIELPGDVDFVPFALDSEHRAGILSHPYLMTGLAYDKVSSPIHRGVFLARSLLGRFLKPPPIAVAPLEVELHPDMTTRERVAMQTSSTTCMACHGMINQLGFSLEEFDAVGRYRTEESGREVDAGGRYIARTGDEVEFRGARELAEFLSHSEEAHTAFTEQLFQNLIKQPIQAFGPEMLPRLRKSFQTHEFSMRHLLGETAVESTLEARRQSAEPGS